MAEIVSTINKSGNDYATLTLWEAAKQADLVTAGNIETAECYDDSGALTDAVTIDGSTTNTASYMKITVASGDRHTGKLSSGASGTGFRLNVTNGNNNGILCSDPAVLVEWLQIVKTATADFGNNCVSNAYITRNCIIKGSAATNSTSGIVASSTDAAGGYAANNIVYDHFRSGAAGNTAGIYSDNITYGVYNNTIHSCTFGIYPEGHGGTAVTAKNNIVNSGGTTDYYTAGGGFSTTSNNISEDATSPNVAFRNKAVTFVDEANDDFHLDSSDTNAKGNGADLGTTPSGVQFDIDNYDRDTSGVTWDIGADQYVSAGTTINSKLMMMGVS